MSPMQQQDCQPCPWCGKRAWLVISIGPGGRCIRCEACGIDGPMATESEQNSENDKFEPEDLAIAKWNTRDCQQCDQVVAPNGGCSCSPW